MMRRFVFVANDISPAATGDSGKFIVVVNWTAALSKK
jgi:hypothetical protein